MPKEKKNHLPESVLVCGKAFNVGVKVWWTVFLKCRGVWNSLIKYVGEEYQVVKRGRENILGVACGEEYNLEKKERRSNNIFDIKAVVKNIKWGREERDWNLGELKQDFKKWVCWRISSCRELYTSLGKGFSRLLRYRHQRTSSIRGLPVRNDCHLGL